MKCIDLSHVIKRKYMMVCPGDPKVSIDEALTHESHSCHVDKLNLNSHTGTHIDAPYHFFKDGKKISDYSADRFVGSGIVINVTGKSENEEIKKEELFKYDSKIFEGCIVVINTGWSRYFGEDRYLNHPYLSKEAAQYLVEKNVMIAAIDTLSIDSSVNEKYDAHSKLLSNEIFIVENLNNLNELDENTTYIFSMMPLNIEESDGSPIRAFAIKNYK